MTRNVATKDAPIAYRRQERQRSEPTKRKMVLLVCGVAALGSVVVASFDASDSPKSPSAPTPGAPGVDVEQSPLQEVFPGCLNDLECYGEPSQLSPGYWERANAAPSG